MLTEEAINEFAEIYEKKFKEKLPKKEMTKRAIKLFSLYKIVYGSQKNKIMSNDKLK